MDLLLSREVQARPVIAANDELVAGRVVEDDAHVLVPSGVRQVRLGAIPPACHVRCRVRAAYVALVVRPNTRWAERSLARVRASYFQIGS